MTRGGRGSEGRGRRKGRNNKGTGSGLTWEQFAVLSSDKGYSLGLGAWAAAPALRGDGVGA